MPDYPRMYFILFNAITDGLTALNSGDLAGMEKILKKAQIQCEELYLQTSE